MKLSEYMKVQLILKVILIGSMLITQTYAQRAPRQPLIGQPGQPGQPEQPPQPGQPEQPPQPPQPGQAPAEMLDQQLQNIIAQQNISPVNHEALDVLPVSDEKVQLGKRLFFSKNLGGEQSVACVSCHHPSLGGTDHLSLPVGIAAVDELNNQADDLLGHGRFNGNDEHPVVPRNSPTIFNVALYPQGLFWDSRIERNRDGEIMTPDSLINAQGLRQPDRNLPITASLADAQARFPVTDSNEMRGDFADGDNNQELRSALVARLNDEIENINSNWPAEFLNVYGDQQVSTNRIFEAIGEYERSMIFVNNPWQSYLAGNFTALTEEQKQGAVLFFTASRDGGAGCVTCHSGSNFSDSRHHLVAFPQIGVGKGDTSTTATSQDFGRENITNNSNDKYHFRTPSLLNIAVTAPYGHSGAYQTLEEVIGHYRNPRASIERLFTAQGGQAFSDGIAPYCQLPQVQMLMSKHNQGCETVFADSFDNSLEVVEFLQDALANQNNATAPLRENARLSPIQINQVAAFLGSLTDPCVQNSECLAPWLLNDNDLATFPDNQAVEGKNRDGGIL